MIIIQAQEGMMMCIYSQLVLLAVNRCTSPYPPVLVHHIQHTLLEHYIQVYRFLVVKRTTSK